MSQKLIVLINTKGKHRGIFGHYATQDNPTTPLCEQPPKAGWEYKPAPNVSDVIAICQKCITLICKEKP